MTVLRITTQTRPARLARTVQVTAAALLLVVAACSDGVTSTPTSVEAARQEPCPQQLAEGQRVFNEWGELTIPDGYQVVEGSDLWSLVGGADDPVYVMSAQHRPLDEVVDELERTTGEVFVEVCSPGGRAMISTPIETADGVGSLSVVEAGPTESILIAATDRSGKGISVRGGLEVVVAGFSISR